MAVNAPDMSQADDRGFAGSNEVIAAPLMHAPTHQSRSFGLYLAAMGAASGRQELPADGRKRPRYEPSRPPRLRWQQFLFER